MQPKKSSKSQSGKGKDSVKPAQPKKQAQDTESAEITSPDPSTRRPSHHDISQDTEVNEAPNEFPQRFNSPPQRIETF